MCVKILQSKNRKKWDEFVNSHSQGNFTQLTNYSRAIEKSLGYKNYSLLLKNNNQTLGLVSFFEFRDFLWRKGAFSSSGILFKESIGRKEILRIIPILKEYFLKLAKQRNFSSFQLKDQIEYLDIFKKYFFVNGCQKNAVLVLDNYDKIYQNFDRQIKKAIKKAERNQVKVYTDNNLSAIKDIFYPIYTKWMKNHHGTPPQSLDFFEKLSQNFPYSFKLYIAEYHKKPIASLLGFFTQKRVSITHSPSLGEYNIYRANDLLHDSFIRWACENNFQYFDFGPVWYEGQMRYKKKWGVEFEDICSFILSNKGSNRRIKTQNSFSKSLKFRFYTFIWRNLVPVFLANAIGPFIRSKLGK